MKREAKLFVKDCAGNACGPFRWTAVRGWVAIGYFTPEDEVRPIDETAWRPIAALPELLTVPAGDDALNEARTRAREKKAVSPRAAAYLKRLGCPVRLERLNPYAAYQWVRIMEESSPALADATEHWAVKEEFEGRVPAASADHATAAQCQILRSLGHAVPENLTQLEAQRLIAGPPTEGQLRRLKFYEITLPGGASKDEAAKLIDRQMRDNWASEEAYQASQKSTPQKSGGRASPAGLQLRRSPAPAPSEFMAPSAAPFPPARRRVRVYVVISGLVAFAITVVAWRVATRAPAVDPTQTASRAATIEGSDEPTPAEIGRLVTVLESPQPALAEQLRTFAISLRMTGTMGGSEPRAFIDGATCRVGDVVDRSRSIVIVQIDAEKNTIVLGDAAGNIVQRVLK